jgi:drug/metabolite transporter (DMT)-like permease
LGQSGGRAYGIALVTLASILWSTAGLFVRLLDLDVWTIQFWRALFSGLSILVLIAADKGWRLPQAMQAIGRPGLAAIPISALSMIGNVAALKLTTVANVLVVYATVPFVAAAVAFLWMGEKPARRTLIASAVALVGIAVMAGAATRPGDIAGCVLSFLMTSAFAVLLVLARRYPSLAMAPVNALGAFLCAAICWPLVPSGTPSASELAILALFGTTTTGLAYLLFLTGARHIPASEAGLIALLDVILGPLWVWLAFGEEPGGPAIIGGRLVLAALLWYLSDDLRRSELPSITAKRDEPRARP